MREFPPFRLDLGNQCLWRRLDNGAEERILVTPKAFEVLSYLVDHAGRLVTQEELLEAVWPDTFVQPEVLKRHIFLLRDVLADDAKSPRFIETLPRRGYQFIAAVRRAESFEPIATNIPAKTTLVGRDRALGDLRAYLRNSLSGQRQIVFITGEAGIGKTTLVDEFQRQSASGPPLQIARGQSVEGYGGKEAYYPMLDALGNLCRSSTGDTVVQILAALAPTWLVQFPSLVKHQQREMLQREILGATRERMLREIAEALDMIASEIPLLLVLEDLHWVDHPTVDLISTITRRREPAKLLFLGTYRPVDLALSEHPLKVVKQDLLVHGLCREVALQPLREIEVGAYLAGESQANLPEGFAELLHRHSGGNPLFMVAALEHMIERDTISHENGVWRLNVPLEAIELEVPENLQEMIETQIEELSAEEQQVLEVASITGVTFSANVNAPAAKLDEEKFEDLCERMSRRKHIVRSLGSHPFPDGSTSQRYEFAHALYREVFYIRMASGRLARLHLRIAERLEEIYRGHEIEIAAELAAHFEEAADWLRAVRYLRTAADSASRRYAHDEAIAILKHAAGLVNRLPELERTTFEVEVLEQLAMFYAALSERAAALETYENLISLASRKGLTDVEARALADMAIPAAWTSARLYLDTLDRALQLSTMQNDPFVRARTQATCFSRRAMAGRWSFEDAECCRKAIEEIERSGDPVAIAEHRLEYTWIQWLTSKYGEAYRYGLESLAILLKRDDLNLFVGVLYRMYRWLVLRLLMFSGEWGNALKEVATQIVMCEKNGDPIRVHGLLQDKAWIHLFAMDFAGVKTIYDSSFASVGLPSLVRIWRILVGSAEVGLGNYDRAVEHFVNAKDEMKCQPLMEDWYQTMPLQLGVVELWLAQGDLIRAREEADRFLKITLETAERTYQGLAWEANARVAIAADEWKRVEECITRALATIEGYEVPLAAWRVHGTAAEIYSRAKNEDLAERHRDLSRATIMRLANSLGSDHPLATIFLSSPAVRRALD